MEGGRRSYTTEFGRVLEVTLNGTSRKALMNKFTSENRLYKQLELEIRILRGEIKLIEEYKTVYI